MSKFLSHRAESNHKLETDKPKIYRTVASVLRRTVLDSAVDIWMGVCFQDQIGRGGWKVLRFANKIRDFP